MKLVTFFVTVCFLFFPLIGETQYEIMFEESFEGGEASELWEEWDGFVTGGTMEVVQDGDMDWRDVAIAEPPESNGYFGKTTISHGSAATNIWKTGSLNDSNYTIEAWIYVPAVTGEDPPDNWFYQYITGYVNEGQQYVRFFAQHNEDTAIRIRVQGRIAGAFYDETFTENVLEDGEGWYHLKMELLGPAAYVYVDGDYLGVLDWSDVDPTANSGQYGVGMYMNGAGERSLYFDDFKAYTDLVTFATDWTQFE